MEVMKASPIENKERQWEPYEDNAGTVAAVSGSTFCVVGADTRMSNGYAIATRINPKLFKLTEKAVLACSGMKADIDALVKRLTADLERFKQQHGKPMSTRSLAQHLSIVLYSHRFFPYYSFCVLCGVDEGPNAEGLCYGYDAVGSFEKVKCVSVGSGQTMVQSFLDNQVVRQHQQILPENHAQPTMEEVKTLVREALTGAAERDIHTGDYCDVAIISATGVSIERFPLKFD